MHNSPKSSKSLSVIMLHLLKATASYHVYSCEAVHLQHYEFFTGKAEPEAAD